MRLLIWYWSATGGGGSQFAVNLARRLALQFGSEAVRLSLHADDPYLVHASALPFTTMAANVITNRRHPVSTITSLDASSRILSQHVLDADYVLVPMNFAVAAPLSLNIRKPLVYFAHDPEPHPGDYARTWQRLTQALLLRKATQIVAPSAYSRQLLARNTASQAKTRVIPLSAVIEPQASAVRTEGPANLLVVGRMIAYKGLDVLLGALKQIQGQRDWRLTVAGDGPALTADAQSQLQSLGADVQKRWLNEGDLTELIRQCDVLLAPYTSATQSGVVAQALAWGKPCVVTPVGALSEQIGEGAGGWIAAAPDGAEFAAAITAALESSTARLQKAHAAHAIACAAWNEDYWGWLNRVRG